MVQLVPIGETSLENRSFLFLQGPHGPFFGQLADVLKGTGAKVTRVGFNFGDRFFWGRRSGYIACKAQPGEWPNELAHLIEEHQITDIVLYGENRPVHLAAIELAKAKGIGLHILEEGYLRPYWVTYERSGSNGNSPLVDLSVTEIRRRMANRTVEVGEAPDHWGAMREHIFYGALYHLCVLTMNRGYRHIPSHRSITVFQEFRLYLRKLAVMPWVWPRRVHAVRTVRRGGFPYHLVMLQLAHDTNFTAHSPFKDQVEFIDDTLRSFAIGAPRHHHLVLKAHPLEDDRLPLREIIELSAKRYGLSNRVHFLTGGKLGALLDRAASAVTVNSTAAQQALWRGLPLRNFGRAVYSKPEFVSNQPLHRFFASPASPDADAYRDYRKFLLETSQIPGSFYSARGRKQLLRQLPDSIFSRADPYELTGRPDPQSAEVQHLSAV